MLNGLDRLLSQPEALDRRAYSLLAHHASVTLDLQPAHLALAASGHRPSRLFAPEHGYYAVEQDMIPAEDAKDPLSGLPIRSLYGDHETSLRPSSEAFEGTDLLIIDLQDIGTRYYTYAATAVWAAEAALRAGLEVWVLDRPNPLGGVGVEGNRREPGFDSFVGAFETPVRHALTLGELVRWVLGDPAELRVWTMDGWSRDKTWPETGLAFIAPSPNMPSFMAEVLYPGLCLVEGTTVSEGRGTTRPFQLVGAPWIDGAALAEHLNEGSSGVRCIPTFFRPQFQKHAGEVCAGVELVVTEIDQLSAYSFGFELIRALWTQSQRCGVDLWRRQAYEFVVDRPAIDLLFGTDLVRRGLESGQVTDIERWRSGWKADEEAFRAATASSLLYPPVGAEPC